MATVALKALPPAEALAYFRSKGLAAPEDRFDYRDVWRGEHAASFVVAKAMRDDVLRMIREELVRAMAEGRTLQAFQADLAPRLEAAGWWGRAEMTDPKTDEVTEVQLGSMHRLRTIFDTNMRTSMAAGRWARIQRTKAAFPYLRYVQVDRPSKRPAHARYNALVRPVDDPVWARIYPPNGYFCACGVEQITQGQIDRGRYEVSDPVNLDEDWQTNYRTGEDELVPVGVTPGFDVNPGMIWLDTERKMEGLAGQDNHAELVGVASQLRLRALHEGFERGAFLDGSGEVRATLAASAENAAQLSWSGMDVAGLDLIHSHPYEGLFSDSDLWALHDKRLRSIALVTPQGTFGALFSGDMGLFQAARNAFTGKVNAASAELLALDRSERNFVIPHALGIWLDRNGVAAYHLSPAGALADILARHADLIERLVE